MYKKVLKDLEAQTKTDIDKFVEEKEEAKRLAAMEKEERILQGRREYYEECLQKARKEITSWSIPDDFDGSLYRALKQEYDLHSKLLYPGEDASIDGMEGDVAEWALYEIGLFVILFIPAFVLWFRGTLLLIMTILMVVLWIVLSCYFAYAAFTPSVKKRLRIAAGCKVMCEILECRLGGNPGKDSINKDNTDT